MPGPVPENLETARIADQFRRAFDGEAWHGPAMMEILADVDGRTASKRPIQHAHTIWELVLHVAAWDDVIIRRLGGEAANVEAGDPENFPLVSDSSEPEWGRAIELLRGNHRKLVSTVLAMTDSRLRDPVIGKDYDVYFMLHGAVQHLVYHAGQMAILKTTRSSV